MSELKPCPFCGGKPHWRDGSAFDEGWSVECEPCWISMGCFETKDEATAAWNRRAVPDLSELRAELATLRTKAEV